MYVNNKIENIYFKYNAQYVILYLCFVLKKIVLLKLDELGCRVKVGKTKITVLGKNRQTREQHHLPVPPIITGRNSSTILSSLLGPDW